MATAHDTPPAGPLRRIGIVGDIHAQHARLAAALDHLERAGVDALFAVGDIVDGTGDVDGCCALLAERGALAVRGNHDRWFLAGELRTLPYATLEVAFATRAFLGALPATRTFATVRGELLLCHGIGRNDMARLRPDDEGYALASNTALHELIDLGRFALVVNGHTHERMVRTVRGLTVINAGTLHQDYAPGFVLADLAAGRVDFFDLAPDGAVSHARSVTLDEGTESSGAG